MRQFMLTLSFAMAASCAAQSPVLLGQERWPDGTLKATRYQEGDRIHFITYHENGRVKEIGCFRRGRRDGLWRQFSDSGVLLAQAGFRNGQRQGVWEFRGQNSGLLGRIIYSEGMLLRGEQYDERGALVAMRAY
ncbi:MAG: toxin-antitoxin system YwqK family antitoxin [Flavobacteriales bacterium]